MQKHPFLKRTLLVYTGILFLVLHFTITLIFCTQDKLDLPKLSYAANKYCYPLFIQNWKMFAPNPPTKNKKINYRFIYTDSTKSEWFNLGEGVLKKFQSNRFWNYGKQYNLNEATYVELVYDKKKDTLFGYLNEIQTPLKSKLTSSIEVCCIEQEIPPINSKTKCMIPDTVYISSFKLNESH